jgi:hypothetical protein
LEVTLDGAKELAGMEDIYLLVTIQIVMNISQFAKYFIFQAKNRLELDFLKKP